MRKELDYQCTHDPLTGLYNRRFLYDEIKKCDEKNVAVVLIDIDNFKKINDCYGHDEGDEILINVSNCLKEEADSSGIFPVRWGGEEFIIFYSQCDEESAYDRISELCRKITHNAVLPDKTGITVTAGLASGKSKDFDELVKKADDYLYQGKKNGKNCIVWEKNEELFSACCLKKATV
jgi:diguanylate cyclase (GGDEF)-like protein